MKWYNHDENSIEGIQNKVEEVCKLEETEAKKKKKNWIN
jgi:hypothetical protein